MWYLMKEKKKSKGLHILRTVLIVFLSIILLINIVIIIQTKTNPEKVPNIFGYKPFIVLSGSMETKINIGDLVIVKEIEPKNLKVNDIIAFREKKDFVTTHRIIEVVNGDDICFKTKGDNNNTADDGNVCAKSIEGKYKFKIPKIGSAILFIQKPLGFMVMIMTIIIVGMSVYFFANRKRKISDEELKEFEEFKKSKEKDKEL